MVMRKAQRARRISLTSLIDVIFLLLLFFMLTSTFSRYSEVPLTAATSGAQSTTSEPPLFARLGPDSVQINTRVVTLDVVPILLQADRPVGADLTVIVSMIGDVSAQRLTDFLVVLRGVSGVRPVILAAS